MIQALAETRRENERLASEVARLHSAYQAQSAEHAGTVGRLQSELDSLRRHDEPFSETGLDMSFRISRRTSPDREDRLDGEMDRLRTMLEEEARKHEKAALELRRKETAYLELLERHQSLETEHAQLLAELEAKNIRVSVMSK
jgi:hypothetical protein